MDDDAYAESDEDEDAEVEHDDVVDDNMVSVTFDNAYLRTHLVFFK